MKETLNLTKVLFKNSLNKTTNKDKMNLKAIVKKLIIFLAIAYIACVIVFFCKEIINLLQEAHQEELFINIFLLISICLAFFQSILSSLNVLYFSKDIEFLLPLPISPIKIVVSKINVMLISEYITEILTFVLPFIVYGVMVSAEPIFYLMTFLLFILLPIVPTLLGIVFTVVLMNITTIFNNKDLVQYLTVFISFAIIISVQVLTMKTSNMTNFMLVNKLIEINGLSHALGKYIIILKQALVVITELNTKEAISNLLYLIGESITAYLVVSILISKSYIKSATNVTSGKVKKVKTKISTKIKSPRNAYIAKEFKLLFRTPVFFLNIVVPVLIVPILLSIPIINLFKNSSESIDLLKTALSSNIQNTMGFAISLAIITFLYMINYASVTCISRDGENAIFMKYIPIELHKQCRYKAVPNFVINLYPLILFIVGIKIILKDLSIVFLLEITWIALLMNILVSYGMILIDLLKPKLHWSTEYSVVKQNLNMLWDFVWIFIMGIVIFGICSFFENVHVLTFLLTGILILTISLYDSFIKQNSINIFKKIS